MTSNAGSVVVIGGGHNGLVAASLLARGGAKVTVVEALPHLGGLCGTATFHPGYRHTGIHHDTGTVRPWVVEALQLQAHGFEWCAPPPVLVATEDGDPIALPGSAAGLAEHLGAPFAAVAGLVEDVTPVLARLIDTPAIDPFRADFGSLASLRAGGPELAAVGHALRVRMLGRDRLQALVRVATLSVEDWLTDAVPDPRIRAAMALPALLGTFMGPRSPHSAGMLLLHWIRQGQEVAGGGPRLVEVLRRGAEHHGVEIRKEQTVASIRIRGGRATGVVLSGGESIDADAVLSTADPRRSLLDLVSPIDLPVALADEARQIRVRATSAKLHLALSGAPSLRGAPGPFERIRVVSGTDGLERAFDAAKHRRLPEAPALDIRLPSLVDPTLAPTGHHVASIHVFGVPHTPRGGWTDATRATLSARVMERLEAIAPGIGETVVGSELLVPPDLATQFGTTGGHLYHGEHALDQLWSLRPGILLSRHETPIPGLYLGSGGVHPCGGPSGASGALAARAVLAQWTGAPR